MKQLVLGETIAIRKDWSRVDQCSECGTLVCHDVGRDRGECPACGAGRWWRQRVPAAALSEDEILLLPGHISGPFYVAEASA